MKNHIYQYSHAHCYRIERTLNCNLQIKEIIGRIYHDWKIRPWKIKTHFATEMNLHVWGACMLKQPWMLGKTCFSLLWCVSFHSPIVYYASLQWRHL